LFKISNNHIKAIVANADTAELVAVADVCEKNAVVRQKQYFEATGKEPKVYTDYMQMLKECDIDIVTIATESGYHPEIAINCMSNGKHVIVEKPMALSTADALKMQECARENNVKLAVCHQNRFNPPVQLLRRALEEGRFGKLVNGSVRILWNRNMDYYKQAPWRGTWELDGGALMNQCIHGIDLLQWMLGGDIDTVYAQTGNFLRDIAAEDFGAIIVRFKSGVIGTIEGSVCVFPNNLSETLSVFGEKGAVVVGGLAVNRIETWRFADEKDYDEAAIQDKTADPSSVYGHGHGPYFRNVIEAVLEDKPLMVDGYEGSKAMKIILAAYKSQQTGLPVKFDELEFDTLAMR
jgi:predicted dehydrogenase